MKAKRMVSLIVAAALTFTVAACGGGSNTVNESAGSSNTATNSGGEAKKITLTLQTIETDKSRPSYQIEEELVNDYMKENPHVTIEWDRLLAENQKVKLKTQSASGEVPDITRVNAGAQLKPFVDGNVFVPLNDILDEEVKGTFVEGVLDFYTFDGNVYALPDTMNIAGIFYNKELLEKAGVQPPGTFEELLEAVRKLKDAGITPIIVAGKDRWPLSFLFMNILQRVNEKPGFLQDVIGGNRDFTDPVFTQAIQRTKDLIAAGAFQEGAVTYDYTTSAQQFQDGKAAMIFNGTWAVAAVESSNVKGKIGFIPFPTIDGKGSLNEYMLAPAYGYAIGANSKNQEESKKFMKYFMLNYSKKAFEKQAAIGLALKVDGDFKAAGYSDLAIEVIERFNNIQGGDLNFDNVIEPNTTQTHLNGLQRLLVSDVKAEDLAKEHQNTWSMYNK
jgi:raffinose/stachyose/melibiose transport system substrate-binding protein